MVTKVTMAALGGVHTAGIYADMTVDGPEIGTLVVVMDRAKNLPNRKSMGKQDPYCAARLGKEAKKTETDKRGGQTPKWDQELRFTVHDSPDYYQLKVSVFNDDKKTELIGETWVSLDQIIIPGGGQNDLWHNLNCKGRSAGQIRIELTYYDTRPRDDKAEERRQSASVTGAMEQGISGPRQPKPVKRRPLPADPTNSTHSSPLPNIPQRPVPQQRYVESPDDYSFETTSPPTRRHQHIQDSQQNIPSVTNNLQHPEPYNGNAAIANPANEISPNQFAIFESSSESKYQRESSVKPNQSPHNRQSYDTPSSYDDEYENRWPSRLPTQPVQMSDGIIHSRSLPAIIDARPRQNSPLAQPYPPSSPPKSQSFGESTTYQYSRDDGFGSWPNADSNTVLDDTAPPPPAHRHSGSRPSTYSNAAVTAPPPLNTRIGRGNVGGSPLSQVYSNVPIPGYQSTSQINSQRQPDSVHSVSTRTSYSQLVKPRSHSPVRELGPIPPSLVPGYEPGIAEDESERLMHESRMSARQQYADPPSLQHMQEGLPVNQTRSQPLQRTHQAPGPGTFVQTRPQPTSRNMGNVQDRRAYRTSAPIINPRKVSPDTRTPIRKSLSPQPGSAPAERRQSGIPFSPDSFDAFNPSLSSDANSINPTGPGYNTPEQAKEAYCEYERQKKLGDGPIIGSDGRIIDPSDHLPTDTWAPEPEQKKPKKGPEVTIRFRQTPRGAQPLPSATRPSLGEVRPHSISTPTYAQSVDDGSLSSGGRNRLQKKAQGVMPQPASSPIVPTLNTTRRSSPLRPVAFDYPLREHENFGGYGNSSTYARGSPGNIPPPVPEKVPINAAQEDWNTLSEEMRRIDIGVGGGERKNRRSRYGI
ncbi:hypothetical protein N7G274_002341 [Stereocaulon virgatum]|uniref:C2 domain-containing protein n=1 Tax=Stereocaulon virgatum TaxID=373712 RepID=A0ABR4AJJ7_9LECA